MPFARCDPLSLSRRTLLGALLGSSALLVGGCGARAASGLSDTKALAAIARTLFPYDFLPDARYEALAQSVLETEPRPSPATVRTAIDMSVRDGQASSEKVSALLATPFGQQLRFATLVGLFADLSVTRRFGYEGPSIEQGGYLERGFDDLAWLPEPSDG